MPDSKPFELRAILCVNIGLLYINIVKAGKLLSQKPETVNFGTGYYGGNVIR